MVVDFEHYRKLREDALLSNDIIYDTIPAGFGGTTQWTGMICNHNPNNVVAVDTHESQLEISTSIDEKMIKTGEIALEQNIVIGKTAVLPEHIQQGLMVPECFCDLYDQDKDGLFDCLKKGFVPYNWCDELCPFSNGCTHKDMITGCWQMARYQDYCGGNTLWILPKAYIQVGMVKNILEKYKSVLFLDELSLSLMMDQLYFSVSHLQNYKNYINKFIIPKDVELYEFWRDFQRLIDILINTIPLKLNKRKPEEEKIKLETIRKEILLFFESYPKSKVFRNWNDHVSYIITDKNLKPRTYNIYNGMLNFLSDTYLFRNDEKHFDHVSSVDADKNSFNYYINKTHQISELIKKSHKFILRNAYPYLENIMKGFFPEINDYCILEDAKSRLLDFKQVFRYTKGTYYKTEFYHNGELTNRWKKTVKEVKKVLDVPLFHNLKWAICSIQEGRKNLEKIFEDNKNIQFMHWFNTKALNRYSGMNMIQIGAPITSQKYRTIIHTMFPTISAEKLLDLDTFGELYQYAGRARTNLNKGLIYIAFSKKIPKEILNEKIINFNRMEDIGMLSYLSDGREVNRKEIQEIVYGNDISERYLRDKLSDMVNRNILEKVGSNKNAKYKIKNLSA